MRTTIFALLLMTVMVGPVIAQDKDEKEVAVAVESLRKALVDPSQADLDRLTCAELSYGHSSGVIQDKATFIEALVSGKSDFVTIDLTQQTIKVIGNVALVRHILSATTNDGGKPGQTKLSILLVWLKQKGAWKLLARQAVKA
jgi:hypothetical protein